MSPARETSAITFGAAAALVAAALSWWLFAMPSAGLLAPMLAVGCVAGLGGALVGEWVGTGRPWVAALIGAALLPTIELFVLGLVFAADTVQRFTLNRPPRWAELFDPRTWIVVLAAAVMLAMIGGASGLVARRWARSVTEA